MIVRGLVQGVGYRWSCQREAERLGVGGWVRNRVDGTVEVAVEGPATRVDALLAWCRQGPRHARVSTVEAEAEELQGDHTFVVR